MENLNILLHKGRKMVLWNRFGLFSFFIGIFSLGITIVLTAKTKHLFFLYSFIPMIPTFIIAGIYDRIVTQTLDEILNIFKDRLKWGINNDDVYDTTCSHIEEFDIAQYSIVVECGKSHVADISALVQEITTDFNNQLPPKFQLLPSVKVKL